MRGGIPRIEVDGPSIRGRRAPIVIQVSAAAELPGQQKLVIGFRVVAAIGIRCLLLGKQLQFQPGDHGRGDLALHLEDVLDVAVIGLRPDVHSAVGPYQLGAHTDGGAGAAHAALEQVRDPQVAADFRRRDLLSLEVERRGACDHLQVRNLREPVDQFLGEPVGEVFLIPRLAEIEEGQHRDGFVDDRVLQARQHRHGAGLDSRLGRRFAMQRVCRSRQNRRSRRGRGGDHSPIAQHEFLQPVGNPGGPGSNGLAAQEAGKILRQVRGAHVALAGFAGESLEDDGVQIAPQVPDELLLCGRPHRAGLRLELRARLLHATLGRGVRVHPGRCAILQAVRARSGQEFVEQHAQGVDVAPGIDRLPVQKFGTGVHRSHGAAIDTGDLGQSRLVRVEQLGDSEVEQPDLPRFGHEDVGRLEVAMNHLLRVRILHGVQNLQKELQAFGDPDPVPVGPDYERTPLDVLHRQVRQPLHIDSRVVETRDMRVLQAGENVALAREALFQIAAHPGRHRQLQGDVALEGAVRAPRQPDLGHAAGAQRPQQLVRADVRARLEAARRRGIGLPAGLQLRQGGHEFGA